MLDVPAGQSGCEHGDEGAETAVKIATQASRLDRARAGWRIAAALLDIARQVNALAATGYSEADANGRFAPGALAGFLQKPYTGATLAQKVKAALA